MFLLKPFISREINLKTTYVAKVEGTTPPPPPIPGVACNAGISEAFLRCSAISRLCAVPFL